MLLEDGDLSRDTGFSPEKFNLTDKMEKEVSRCEKIIWINISQM